MRLLRSNAIGFWDFHSQRVLITFHNMFVAFLVKARGSYYTVYIMRFDFCSTNGVRYSLVNFKIYSF